VWFGILFAVVSVISAGLLLPGVQANLRLTGYKMLFSWTLVSG
jgi:AGCS family alanine or glycine:cation symporter